MEFPEYSIFDEPEDYPDYLYDIIYGRCDILNRKIVKAYLAGLAPKSPVNVLEADGIRIIHFNGAVTSKNHLDELDILYLDRNGLTPVKALFKDGLKRDIYPFRTQDLAAYILEEFVPEDIWLEGLSDNEKDKIKAAVKLHKENKQPEKNKLFKPEEAKHLKAIFEKIECVRASLPFNINSIFGGVDISCELACYYPRLIRETRNYVNHENGVYATTLYAWPFSDYEYEIIETYETVKCIERKEEHDEKKSTDILAEYLKNNLEVKVIHGYEFTKYALLLSEAFPGCNAEDVRTAIRRFTDEELYSLEH